MLKRNRHWKIADRANPADKLFRVARVSAPRVLVTLARSADN
jgi:hypothetical protein